MKIITVLTFQLAVLLSVSVTAGEEDIFESGTSLLAACNMERLSEHWYCAGYVASAWDTQTLSEQICPPKPEGVTKGQLKRVVMAYLEAHPEELHLAGISVVQSALIEAFPCTEP